MPERIGRYWRRENWPWWGAGIIGFISIAVRVVGWLDDINFMVSNANRLHWVENVFVHPAFGIVAVSIGLGGLLLFGRGPTAQVRPNNEMRAPVNGHSARPIGSRGGTLPAVAARTARSDDTPKLVDYGPQHHAGPASVELLLGIYERESVAVKCTVINPDNLYHSRTSGIEVGLSYYPVRFVYPDDFEGAPTLSRGRYRVVWTRSRWRLIQRGFSLSAVLSLQEERYEEEEVGRDEFTVERSAPRKVSLRKE